jgi:hypothetical protein
MCVPTAIIGGGGAGLGTDLVVTEHPQFATESILLDLPLHEIVVCALTKAHESHG